jgi:hypothetical protein
MANGTYETTSCGTYSMEENFEMHASFITIIFVMCVCYLQYALFRSVPVNN